MKQSKSIRILCECSIMVALSTVLWVLKVFVMPYGGSTLPRCTSETP